MPVEGDSVAVIGDNRKLLMFPLDELPEMTRGKGVRLQRYKDGGLADAKVFSKKDGLTYIDAAGRSFAVTELRDWWGQRAQAGRLPPQGLPQVEQLRPALLDRQRKPSGRRLRLCGVCCSAPARRCAPSLWR